jgi:hypothetical protein
LISAIVDDLLYLGSRFSLISVVTDGFADEPHPVTSMLHAAPPMHSQDAVELFLAVLQSITHPAAPPHPIHRDTFPHVRLYRNGTRKTPDAKANGGRPSGNRRH